MSRPPDDYRTQARTARVAAETINRHDMKRAALDIAEHWERLADMADKQPNKAEETGS